MVASKRAFSGKFVAALSLAAVTAACSPAAPEGDPSGMRTQAPVGGGVASGDLQAESAAFFVELWLADLSSSLATEDESQFIDLKIENPEWQDNAAELAGGAEIADTLRVAWHGGRLQVAGDGTYIGHKTIGRIELSQISLVDMSRGLRELTASDKANGITFHSAFRIEYAARISQRYFEPVSDVTGDPDRNRVNAWLRGAESLASPDFSSWFDGRHQRTVGLKDGRWADLSRRSGSSDRCLRNHTCYVIDYGGNRFPFESQEFDRYGCVKEEDAPNYESPPPCLITTVVFNSGTGVGLPTPTPEVRLLGANETLNVGGATVSITRPPATCEGFSFALRIENPTPTALQFKYVFEGGAVWGGGDVSADCYPERAFDGVVDVPAKATVEVGFRDIDYDGPTVLRVEAGTGAIALWSLEH